MPSDPLSGNPFYLYLLRRMTGTYTRAARDLQKKFEDFNKKWAAQDKQKRAMKDSGAITEDEYQEWVSHQVFTSNLWKEKAADAARMMTRANVETAALVQDGKISAFTAAANYAAYEVEHRLGIRTSLSLYNRESVSRLLLGNPQLLPEWKIDEPKDYVWNYRKVENSITQGIIQGKPIPEITKGLVEDLQAQNESKMTMFARTGMTGAQNAGRMDAMHRQQELGIKVRKKWIATNDDRTRDSHADLDGQIVDVDEPFQTTNRDGSPAYIDYPGDPTADPEQTYNCRCTMVYVYPDIEELLAAEEGSIDIEPAPEAREMSYEEWIEANENRELMQHTSNPFRR